VLKGGGLRLLLSAHESAPHPYTRPHPTPCTLHPTPYTLHLTPYTLSLTPYTLHLTSYALHPTPYTLHPSTLNCKYAIPVVDLVRVVRIPGRMPTTSEFPTDSPNHTPPCYLPFLLRGAESGSGSSSAAARTRIGTTPRAKLQRLKQI